jgi:hypothetical protein
VHDACRDPLRDRQTLHDVAGHDPERKPVRGVRRQARRLLRRGERDHRRNRTEDLLRERGHPGGDAGQDRRGVTESLEGPAGEKSGSLVHGLGHDAVHLVPLAGVDQRAERDRVGGRVPDGERGRPGREPGDELVVHVLVDQVAAGCHADLALVEEAAPGGEPNRVLDVRVVEDDEGRVAAELQVSALEVTAR